MTTTTTTAETAPSALKPLSQQAITDALHTILRAHMQTAHPVRQGSGGFKPTSSQRNAELTQAMQHAQRNL